MKNVKVKNAFSTLEGGNDTLELIFRDRIRCSALMSAATYHELYTPLVIIRGLAESLMRKSESAFHSYLLEISKEAEQLLKNLEAMNFKDPGENPKVQNILLRPVVEQSVIFFKKVCLEKGISVRLEIDRHLHVLSEPTRLKSIIISLLEFAVDSFSNQKMTRVKSITIHAEGTDDAVHLIVSDTGEGISIENQQKMTEELAKGAALMDLNHFLSLAMTKKISDALGITMNFVSEKARGTSFTLSFPKKSHLSQL